MNKIEEGIAANDTAIAAVKSGYLPLSGGTLTGKLTIGSTTVNKDLDVKGNVDCKNLSAKVIGASGGTIYAANFNTENPNNGNEAVHIEYDGTITTNGSIVLNNDGGTLTGISNSKGTSSTIAASQKCLADNYLPLTGGTITGDTTIIGTNGQYGLKIVNGDIYFLTDGGSTILYIISGIVSEKGTSATHAMSQKGVADNYVAKSDLPSNLLKYQIVTSTSQIGTDTNTAYLILE